jgi:protein-S-isoprenylcysteine O-methyltransferase Ste14
MSGNESAEAMHLPTDSVTFAPMRRLNPIAVIVACWLGGWILGILVSFNALPALLRWIGIPVFAAGFPLGVPALRGMIRARTSPNPARTPTSLVVTGIYRYTRNPMYLGMLLLYSGAALLVGVVGPFVLLPVAWVLLDRWVVRSEEQRLHALFGQSYEEYSSHVRRWV